MVVYANAKILEQYQKLMSDLLEQIDRQNRAIEQQTEMAALGAGFIRSGNVYIKQSKLVSSAVGMVEAYQWFDGRAALNTYTSSIGKDYGDRSVMDDLPKFLEDADTVQVESFFAVQKLILQKAFEKIMGTGTAAERKNSKDKDVIGDLAWWIGTPAGTSEKVQTLGEASQYADAKTAEQLKLGGPVSGIDALKYIGDPGFGELGSGGNRPSGIYLGFYNKLDLVSRYVDMKDTARMERIEGSVDPISATINQFNPVVMLANAVQNVRVASEVYGTDEAYMWEAQVLGAYKGMANTLGTAVAAAFSWTGVGIAIGAAIIASGNAIQVDTKTGSRDAVMNDRAAVGTAIGLASMYAGDLTSGANVAAADRLLAAAINTSASSIGAGFSYNDHGNITGWTLSGSNGDAFWQNMGTGALSAGISEGFIQGFNVNNAYAKDIISSVSSTGVNTFAEYYKYNQGYQNNYAAMANPDIGNASAFWGLAVTMGGRASRDNSATNTTSGDWSWDNTMSGFAEGALSSLQGLIGLGSLGQFDPYGDMQMEAWNQAFLANLKAKSPELYDQLQGEIEKDFKDVPASADGSKTKQMMDIIAGFVRRKDEEEYQAVRNEHFKQMEKHVAGLEKPPAPRNPGAPRYALLKPTIPRLGGPGGYLPNFEIGLHVPGVTELASESDVKMNGWYQGSQTMREMRLATEQSYMPSMLNYLAQSQGGLPFPLLTDQMLSFTTNATTAATGLLGTFLQGHRGYFNVWAGNHNGVPEVIMKTSFPNIGDFPGYGTPNQFLTAAKKDMWNSLVHPVDDLLADYPVYVNEARIGTGRSLFMNTLKSPYFSIGFSTVVGGVVDYRNGVDPRSYQFMVNRGVDTSAATIATMGGVYATAMWTTGLIEAGFLSGSRAGLAGALIGAGVGLGLGLYMDNYAAPETKQYLYDLMLDIGIDPTRKMEDNDFWMEMWIPGRSAPKGRWSVDYT